MHYFELSVHDSVIFVCFFKILPIFFFGMKGIWVTTGMLVVFLTCSDLDSPPYGYGTPPGQYPSDRFSDDDSRNGGDPLPKMPPSLVVDVLPDTTHIHIHGGKPCRKSNSAMSRK